MNASTKLSDILINQGVKIIPQNIKNPVSAKCNYSIYTKIRYTLFQ